MSNKWTQKKTLYDSNSIILLLKPKSFKEENVSFTRNTAFEH